VTDYVSKSGSNEFKMGVSATSNLGNVLNSQLPTTYRSDIFHELNEDWVVDVSHGSLIVHASLFNVFHFDTAPTYNDVAEHKEGVDSPNYRNPTIFNQ
jgi:hypothetical protein